MGDPSRDTSREVISFGDSMEERTAVKIVSKQLYGSAQACHVHLFAYARSVD